MKKVLLRTLISVGFLALLFYLVRDNVPGILRAINNIHRPLLAASTLIFISTVFILAWRLKIIFAAKGVSIKFSDCANLTFIGYFFNNFLPTSVGGDIVKAMCAARVTGHSVKSVTVVLMDRIFGLFTFILIPSISLLFFMKTVANPTVPTLVYAFLATSIACFFLLFNRSFARRFRFLESLLGRVRMAQKARSLYDELHMFKHHKLVMFQAMMLSIVGQSIGIFVLYLLAVALGAHASVVYFYLLVPVVQLISMLPSLNGLGIREGAYVYFLSPYIGRECSAAVGVLYLALLLLLSVIGGLIYLVRQKYHVRFNFKENASSLA